MCRKEQIQEAAESCADRFSSDECTAFIRGVEWADANPDPDKSYFRHNEALSKLLKKAEAQLAVAIELIIEANLELNCEGCDSKHHEDAETLLTDGLATIEKMKGES